MREEGYMFTYEERGKVNCGEREERGNVGLYINVSSAKCHVKCQGSTTKVSQ